MVTTCITDTVQMIKTEFVFTVIPDGLQALQIKSITCGYRIKNLYKETLGDIKKNVLVST